MSPHPLKWKWKLDNRNGQHETILKVYSWGGIAYSHEK